MKEVKEKLAQRKFYAKKLLLDKLFASYNMQKIHSPQPRGFLFERAGRLKNMKLIICFYKYKFIKRMFVKKRILRAFRIYILLTGKMNTSRGDVYPYDNSPFPSLHCCYKMNAMTANDDAMTMTMQCESS